MRSLSLITSLLAIGVPLAAAAPSVDAPATTPAKHVRTKSILFDYPRQYKVPTLAQLEKRGGTSLNLKNIQGDILIGMKKPAQLIYFFRINNARNFKAIFKKNVIPLITSVYQMADVPANQPDAIVNVAFTQTGLQTLGIRDDLKDPHFKAGQYVDSYNLGDATTKNWVPTFKGTATHGVFIISSDQQQYIDAALAQIQTVLTNTTRPAATEVHRLLAVARPGEMKGHEHFGFLDGFGQPYVDGFSAGAQPGFSVIPPGILLLGNDGDLKASQRPKWTKDGSFLVFRQLQELAPEFDAFIMDNAIQDPSGKVQLTQREGADLLAARMFGRWPSGAAIDLTPLHENATLAADAVINDFDFSHPGMDINSDQSHCPFSAHIRKVRPRADQNNTNVRNQMLRAGLPYGPEVTDQEKAKKKSLIERGLAFTAYQSSLADGFRFQQISMANNATFPPGKSDPTPGADPIIGQANGQPRVVSGLNPFDPSQDYTLPIDYIVSRGGDYFFAPPISALASVIAA